MRTLYTLVLILALPLILARLWYRGRRLPAYRKRIGERFACLNTSSQMQPVIWIHAVSVGEFIAARPLVKQLLSQTTHAIFITTTTPTGSEQVTSSFDPALFASGRLQHSYLPYDIPLLIKRFLDQVKPKVAVIMETELWPNTIACCKRAGINVIVANARMSEKSARGYHRVGMLSRPMFQAIDKAAIQNQDDAKRMLALGLRPQAAEVIGSIKFDITIPAKLQLAAQQLKMQLRGNGNRKIFIAASTHRGEEEAVLSAFKDIQRHHPNCLLLLVPRHPDRFDEVHSMCVNAGFACKRRSREETPQVEDQILLGDTMGELMLFYGASDIAFIGGSLIAKGGHNYIEAALWQLPIVTGSSTFNFADIVRLLAEKNAITIVENGAELGRHISAQLSDETQAAAQGLAAKAVAEQNRGALARLFAMVILEKAVE